MSLIKKVNVVLTGLATLAFAASWHHGVPVHAAGPTLFALVAFIGSLEDL